MAETITYCELCTRLGHAPSVPVWDPSVADALVYYLPASVATPVQQDVQDAWLRNAQGEGITVILVTDVPHDRLFGDWCDAAPDAATRPASAEGEVRHES